MKNELKQNNKVSKLTIGLFSVLTGVLLTSTSFGSVSADEVGSKQSDVSITFVEGNKGVSIKNQEIEVKEYKSDKVESESEPNMTKNNSKLSDIDLVTDYQIHVKYVNPELELGYTDGVYKLSYKDLNSIEYTSLKEDSQNKTVISYNNKGDYLLGKEYIEVLKDKEGISNINLTIEDLNELSKEDEQEGYIEYLFVDGVK